MIIGCTQPTLLQYSQETLLITADAYTQVQAKKRPKGHLSTATSCHSQELASNE